MSEEDLDSVTPGAREGEKGRRVTHGQGRHQQDEEVQSHGHGHSRQQPGVQPGWHPQQRLVLRNAARTQGTHLGPGCIQALLWVLIRPPSGGAGLSLNIPLIGSKS